MAQISPAEAAAVAKAFTDHYYRVYDSNRAGLVNLYQAPSTLVFQGQKVVGAQQIAEKLAALPFQSVQHRVTSIDAQASGAGPRGVLVVVTGDIALNGAEQHKFTQMFHLVPSEANPASFWVHNDVFRTG